MVVQKVLNWVSHCTFSVPWVERNKCRLFENLKAISVHATRQYLLINSMFKLIIQHRTTQSLRIELFFFDLVYVLMTPESCQKTVTSPLLQSLISKQLKVIVLQQFLPKVLVYLHFFDSSLNKFPLNFSGFFKFYQN